MAFVENLYDEKTFCQNPDDPGVSDFLDLLQGIHFAESFSWSCWQKVHWKLIAHMSFPQVVWHLVKPHMSHEGAEVFWGLIFQNTHGIFPKTESFRFHVTAILEGLLNEQENSWRIHLCFCGQNTFRKGKERKTELMLLLSLDLIHFVIFLPNTAALVSCGLRSSFCFTEACLFGFRYPNHLE